MDENVKTHLIDALKKLDTVMLTTTASDGTMHGRPMAVAQTEGDGDLWFVSGKSSEKTQEIQKDARGLVTAQDGGLYVSLSGTLNAVEDRAKVAQLWKEAWRAWFPEGKEDPNIVLLRLTPEVGEYWDQTGGKGLKYLFEAAKAIVEGKRVEPKNGAQHAKVPM